MHSGNSRKTENGGVSGVNVSTLITNVLGIAPVLISVNLIKVVPSKTKIFVELPRV